MLEKFFAIEITAKYFVVGVGSLLAININNSILVNLYMLL